MWEPPPSFGDMLGDAELAAPWAGDYTPLAVPEVGTVLARRPRPDAIPHLALSVNPATDPQAQQHHATLFVRNHIAPDDHERILAAMMDETMPDNTIGLLARALATWGTERPYVAVMTLAYAAADHWRALRTRLRGDGHPNPMTTLTSMHDILDEAEKLWLESLQTGNEDRDQHEQTKLFDKLYGPEPGTTQTVSKGTVRPAGFEPGDVATDFKAAARALGAR
ncbi:hypothetical protein [Mycobacterium sp. DL440]|uniref:DUF7240 domain-containing protein n=1 Tax=Mycobacterium sp. DL440 TaxID=2675523 RepID=UPI001FBA5F64|nr:hypothetical protein [Mycobacterium sp. DL440]